MYTHTHTHTHTHTTFSLWTANLESKQVAPISYIPFSSLASHFLMLGMKINLSEFFSRQHPSFKKLPQSDKMRMQIRADQLAI
jgi:hypothetical protein